MTLTDPSDLPEPRPVEMLQYESAGQTIDPRWLIRMIALIVLARALSGLAAAVFMAINNFSASFLDARFLLSQIRLPSTVLLTLAAVLLLLRRRAALGMVIAAYGAQIVITVISVGLQIASAAAAAKVFPPAAAQLRWPGLVTTGVSTATSVAFAILEAVAIIAIVARCRRAGALN